MTVLIQDPDVICRDGRYYRFNRMAMAWEEVFPEPVEYTDLSATELFQEDEQSPLTSPLMEALAEYAHDAWSGWMRYLFSKSQENEDESVTIPADLVARWKRQMVTYYANLPESEKQSDRKEAKKMIRIFIQHLDEGDD